MLLPKLTPNQKIPNLETHTIKNPNFKDYGEIFIADLSIERIIEAYSKGVFPYGSSNDLDYLEDFTDEIKNSTLWCYPEQRYILDPTEFIDKVNKSRNFRKSINKFECKVNTDFEQIIRGCMNMTRTEGEGTWMSEEFINNYLELNKLGYAYSIGAYKENKLCGGTIGIGIGNLYTGDTMFRNTQQYGEKFTQNASKAALTHLAKLLSPVNGIIDCQYHTPFFEKLGGKSIQNNEFQKLVQQNILGTIFNKK
jgi:leucyl/phenylalanyl-tRNA--protein transferase